MKIINAVAWCLVAVVWCQAQPAYYTLEGVNATRATFRADGLLFSDGEGGGFELAEGGGAFLRRAGLWIMGVDPSGNLKGAIHPVDSSTESDFESGFLSNDGTEVLGAQQFWEVAREDVTAHLLDYYDDGIVDEPIEAIFSWPGRDNPFSETYNGFALPLGKELAPFWDDNENEVYEPHKGDYPLHRTTGSCGSEEYKFIWFAYHSNLEELPSDLLPPSLEIHTIASIINCNEEPIIKQTIFLNKTIHYYGTESIDSTYIGLHLDMAVGCPGDEYLGCVPLESSIFTYNSNFEESACPDSIGFEGSPPVFVAKQTRGLADENGNEKAWSVVMPILEDNENILWGKRPPESKLEYYNNLTGSWRDGSHLTYGGDGYQSSSQKTSLAFPDPPYLSSGWSERAEQLEAGQRRAIAASGPFRWDFGQVKKIDYSFTIINDAVSDTLDANFDRLYEEVPHLDEFIFCSNMSELRYFECSTTSSLRPDLVSRADLVLSPNPACAELQLTINNGALQQTVSIFNLQGAPQIPPFTFLGNTTTLDVSHLPEGIYFVQCRASDGRTRVKKMVKACN